MNSLSFATWPTWFASSFFVEGLWEKRAVLPETKSTKNPKSANLKKQKALESQLIRQKKIESGSKILFFAIKNIRRTRSIRRGQAKNPINRNGIQIDLQVFWSRKNSVTRPPTTKLTRLKKLLSHSTKFPKSKRYLEQNHDFEPQADPTNLLRAHSARRLLGFLGLCGIRLFSHFGL